MVTATACWSCKVLRISTLLSVITLRGVAFAVIAILPINKPANDKLDSEQTERVATSIFFRLNI